MANQTFTLALALESGKFDKDIKDQTSKFSKFLKVEDELIKNFYQHSTDTYNNIGKIAIATAEVQERVKALDSLNLKSFDTVEKLNTARMQAIENEIAADAKKGKSIEKTNELYKQKEQMLIEQSETAKKRVEKEYDLLIEAAEKTGSDITAIETAKMENIAIIDQKSKEGLKKNETEYYAAVKAIVDKGLKETTDLLTKNIYHGGEKLDKDSEKKLKRLEKEKEDQIKIIEEIKNKELVEAEGRMEGEKEVMERKAARLEALEIIHNAQIAKIKEDAAKNTAQKVEEVAKKTEESAKKAEGAWTQVFNVGEMSKNIKNGLKNIKHYDDQLTISMQNEIIRFKQLEAEYKGDEEKTKALYEAKKEIMAIYAAEKMRVGEMITTAEEKENSLRMAQWKLYLENAKTAMENVNKHASEVQKYTDQLNTSATGINDALKETYGKELEELTTNITEKEGLIKKHNENITEIEAEKTAKINELKQQGLNDEQIANNEKIISLNEQIGNEKGLRDKELEEKEKYEKEKAKKEKHRKQQQRIASKIETLQKIVKAAIDISAGATKALSYGPILGPVLAALVTGMGAVQIGIMTKQLAKLEDGGLLRGKRHSQGGMRIEGTNIEVEGGEYVVNRQSTSKNLGLVRYINSQRKELTANDMNSYFAKAERGYEPPFNRMFQTGGELPAVEVDNDTNNQMLIEAIKAIRIESKVAVTDIHRVQDEMVHVDGWSGI